MIKGFKPVLIWDGKVICNCALVTCNECSSRGHVVFPDHQLDVLKEEFENDDSRPSSARVDEIESAYRDYAHEEIRDW